MLKLVGITCIVFFGEIWVGIAVDITKPESTNREKECYGSSMGFSFSGSHEFHYESLRRRFKGCTHVHGNLEVTNLYNGNVTYDLSFLSTIRVVTGYVLLGLLNTEVIPLTSLQFIRGDQTIKLGEERYSLAVALTSEGTPTPENPNPGLKELQMPALREISKGKVIFTQNPMLCYVDTVAWDLITKDHVVFKEETKTDHCGQCSEKCQPIAGRRHCWGSGHRMCQKSHGIKCDEICRGPCFADGMLGCCHPQCATGCHGPLDTQCRMCKHFRHGRRCLPHCPEGTYPVAQECTEL